MNRNTLSRLSDVLVLTLAVTFALYLRYVSRYVVSGDFRYYTSLWYEAVQRLGFAAAGTDVANYNPPYLYILYLTSVVFPNVAPVVAIKIPSVAGDFACAWFVYLIVRLRYPESRIPMFAFIAVLLAPTVTTNSGVWGQADSIYTSMLLACVYCLMTGRSAWAATAFGLALSLKLQAVFLAPALCAIWLKSRVPLRTLLLIPGVYVLALLPAWLAGRPAAELATIYLAQSAKYQELTMNAPSLYSWLPPYQYGVFVRLGLLLTATIGCFYLWSVWRSKATVTQAVIMKLCMLSVIMTPFFLPKMHDRFFYAADVLSIAYAFLFPRQYFVPVCVSFASYFAYQRFLTGRFFVPLEVLSLVMLVALIAVAWSTRQSLKGADPGPVIIARR